MKKIDEQIRWYEQNATSLYDEVVRIELKKINELYDKYEDCTDELFVNEMIEAFCKIIEKQRERIDDLETEAGADGVGSFAEFAGQPFGAAFMGSTQATTMPQEGFRDDKQLQEAFTVYCLSKGKSSYTVNDYCSRIKNSWKLFYAEYQQGELPKELEVDEEKIKPGSPLLNAYHHTEELACYISMKIAASEGNRNWANTRAAFNKFDEFRLSVEK